jgi:hypothetical protein
LAAQLSPQELQKLVQDIQANLAQITGAQKRIFENALNAAKGASDEAEQLNFLLEQTSQHIDKVRGSLSYVYESFKDSVNELSKQNSYLVTQRQALSKLSSIAQDTLSIRRGDSVLQDKKFQKSLDEVKIRKEELDLVRRKGGLQGNDLKNIEDQIKKTGELLQSMKEVQKVDDETLKKLGAIPNLASGIDKALSKLGLPPLGFEDALNKTRMLAQEAQGMGEEINATSAYFGFLKENLLEVFTIANLIQISLVALIDALKGADQSAGELAKSFGTSYNEALGIRNELLFVSNTTNDINVNTKSLQESLVAINKEFGTATMFSGEILTDFTQLTKVAGISVEAAARLSKITTATGGDLSDNTAQILGQATAFNIVNGLALNEKEIVEDVSKASSAITLSMGMSVGELTKAVAQAKAFGLELAQVEQIQNSLLQFESSIEAELEAELLLGKNINLEKARQAALDNDLATLAKEIAEQAGSAADFADMNVIQQEALAKAVGMTRDGLADSLLQQEALAAAGMKEGSAAEAYNELKKQGLSDDRIAEELGSKRLAQQLKSQSNQEKFNATVEKLREIFVSLADPILKIVTPFMDLAATILPLVNMALLPITEGITYIVDSTKALIDALRGNNKELTVMQGIVGSIASLYLIIKGRALAIQVIEGVKLAIQARKVSFLEREMLLEGKGLAKSIGRAIFNIFSSFAKIPMGIGLPLAGIAIAGMYSLYNKFKTADDLFSPGYGKRTLMAPEGAIALNDKDTVIAGTDLGGGGDGNTQSINLSPLIERMSAVENVLVQILNKNVDVYLDSDKVGTSFNVNTVSVQ